jgi:phenylpropionate dioxygenase-like ring-hydroxylating dioxygenase large terminal subunit
MEQSEISWEHRRIERAQELAQTSRASLMGTLLRRFWHPVALSTSVAPGKARAVRLLGEDLTLYRGQSGRAYLVGGKCAHRLTLLHTGWVEGERIRCMYHGWQYDGSGLCVHRPAEKEATSEIRIDGYPVHEYCGVIFAYMGEGNAPAFDLWRKPSFEKPGMLIFPRKEIWPCNWLQNVENSIDSVHVSFTHQMGRVGAFGEAITAEIPDLTFRETEAGICQIAVRSGNQVRVSDWTFPYCNHVSLPGLTAGDPWLEIAHWMVPVDDRRTMRLAVFAAPSTTPEADRRLTEYFDGCSTYNAADHHDELFAGQYPSDPLVRLTSAQDYVVLVGQGTIADRAHERLGYSDGGVTLLRRILWRELDAIRTGKPPKEWRRLQQPSKLFEDGSTRETA